MRALESASLPGRRNLTGNTARSYNGPFFGDERAAGYL